jgi:hypothetical protein
MIRRAFPIVLLTLACGTSPEDSGSESTTTKGKSDVQAYGELNERQSTRILYFVNSTPPESPGQIAIDYGQPQWKSEYEEKFDELTLGKRWRFGNNFWTSLDTNVPFAIGETEVSPGYYYLVLERSQSDAWYLVFLDPVSVGQAGLDAFFVDEAPEGFKAGLKQSSGEETAEKLTVKLIPLENDLGKARLEIRWGPHLLTADINVKI